MSLFGKLKERLFKSSSKLDEGLNAIVASDPAPEPEMPDLPEPVTPELPPPELPEPAWEVPEPEPVELPDPELVPLLTRELTVKLASSTNVREGLEAIASGGVDVLTLISRRSRLSQAREALAATLDREVVVSLAEA